METKSVPPYGSSHVGWWPDVILDFMDKTDIQAGDAQSFWVRFRAPKDQAPGVYQGKLEVLSAGKAAYAFDLRVEVYPFTLPDRSPLDLAITFSPGDHPSPETQAQQAEWRKSADYPIHAWQQHRLEWADFLADYYITYDSLYHRGSPDFEILQRLHEQGQLGRFNLGYYGACSARARGAGGLARTRWPRIEDRLRPGEEPRPAGPCLHLRLRREPRRRLFPACSGRRRCSSRSSPASR